MENQILFIVLYVLLLGGTVYLAYIIIWDPLLDKNPISVYLNHESRSGKNT